MILLWIWVSWLHSVSTLWESLSICSRLTIGSRLTILSILWWTWWWLNIWHLVYNLLDDFFLLHNRNCFRWSVLNNSHINSLPLLAHPLSSNTYRHKYKAAYADNNYEATNASRRVMHRIFIISVTPIVKVIAIPIVIDFHIHLRIVAFFIVIFWGLIVFLEWLVSLLDIGVVVGILLGGRRLVCCVLVCVGLGRNCVGVSLLFVICSSVCRSGV